MGQIPSEMLNSRQIRTLLDPLHPSQQQVQETRSQQQQQAFSAKTVLILVT